MPDSTKNAKQEPITKPRDQMANRPQVIDKGIQCKERGVQR